MNAKTWLIEPHDSLIVRDGRPFNATAGSRAKSMDFPVPSTLIGSIRTRIGLEMNGNSWAGFDEASIKKLLEIEMRGALLAEIKSDKALQLFAPAPSDALLIKPEKEGEENLFPLTPLAAGYLSDIPDGLHLLGIKKDIKGKPSADVKFWNWAQFEKWLIKPEPQVISNNLLGIGGLVNDLRTHVKIYDEGAANGVDGYSRKANADGGLFQTKGLEFTMKDDTSRNLKFRRLALALQIYAEEDMKDGVFPLGGEKRVASWSQSDFTFPGCPEEVPKGIKESGHCRLILLTPAFFDEGFMPDEQKLGAKVKAVAVNRAQVASGWDFKLRKPKPTRRLVPAGSVYFLEITGDVNSFIEKTWFNNIGDCEQTKRDGFGLATLGTWDGKYHEI